MAKIKKKRVKKYNPVAKTDELAAGIAYNAINRISFTGSSVEPIHPYGGLGFNLTTDAHVAKVALSYLCNTLEKQPLKWSVWLGYYFEGENGAIVGESVVASMEDYTLSDFTDGLNGVVDYLKPETDLHYVGYGIFATPHGMFDLDKMSDGMLQGILDDGVGTPDKHLSPEKRDITLGEMRVLIHGLWKPFDFYNLRKEGAVDKYTVIENDAQSAS